jgi:uncharacterized protein
VTSTALLPKSGIESCRNRVLKVAENRYCRSVSSEYVTRMVDPLLDRLLVDFPAIALVGPRAAGKTTTAIRRAGTVLRLDVPDIRRAVAADPDALLRGLTPPVVLDEWQEVPEVLGAVKRAVDSDPTPGRFILTGSVRAELESHTWPGTGRVLQVPMYGMTVRERVGDPATEPFIDRVAAQGVGAVHAPATSATIRDYLDLMLAGSFPEPALRMQGAARRRWFAGYVEQMITRDVPAVAPRRDPELLRRYLSALAVNSAGVVSDSTLSSAVGIDAKTAAAYRGLVQRMFVLDVVPAWFSNRLKRLMKSPKLHLVDPALVAAVLGLSHDAILYGPDMLGRLVETFVAAQLRAELAVSDLNPRMYHLREEHGRREVDLVVETGGSGIIGIEVKASSTVTASDARHLTWLRDETGDQFRAGIVFHTGSLVFPLEDRIVAAPIGSLWTI